MADSDLRSLLSFGLCPRLSAFVAIVGQLSVLTDAATRAAPDGCNMIV